MPTLVDTPAFMALLNRSDSCHKAVVKTLAGILGDGEEFITHGEVEVETIAIVDRRFGLEPV